MTTPLNMTDGERMVWAAVFAEALASRNGGAAERACATADAAVHSLRFSGQGPGRVEMVTGAVADTRSDVARALELLLEARSVLTRVWHPQRPHTSTDVQVHNVLGSIGKYLDDYCRDGNKHDVTTVDGKAQYVCARCGRSLP